MSKQAHPLYGKPLVVNISAVINDHTGKQELTVSLICEKLIRKFPEANKKSLARRVRSCINSLSQSNTIQTKIGQTPDHRLPYIIIIK